MTFAYLMCVSGAVLGLDHLVRCPRRVQRRTLVSPSTQGCGARVIGSLSARHAFERDVQQVADSHPRVRANMAERSGGSERRLQENGRRAGCEAEKDGGVSAEAEFTSGAIFDVNGASYLRS